MLKLLLTPILTAVFHLTTADAFLPGLHADFPISGFSLPVPFMVRKMNHRFKNFITMNVAVGSAVTAGHLVAYDEKMRVSAHF